MGIRRRVALPLALVCWTILLGLVAGDPRSVVTARRSPASAPTTSSPSTPGRSGRTARNTTRTAVALDRNEVDHDEDTLLLSSSSGQGGGKGGYASSDTASGSDGDEKKSLSQQIKEGKYGLIQNEIQEERPIRPGIISYADNPEVPSDTINTLGGLDEEEIWLAENHVLVLKGGGFPAEGSRPSQQSQNYNRPGDHQHWSPIDDYEAPRRQVKIPSRPKVPPPFPVQLGEGLPIQLLGANGSTLLENGTLGFETIPGGFHGFLPGEGPFFPPSNLTDVVNITFPERKHKADQGGPPPGTSFYPALPPGAVIVPPPRNMSDYDDDDQSMYYPPSYSFIYQPESNATAIPPGPLVPGIILPPPPDFFSTLTEDVMHSSKPQTMIKSRYHQQMPSTTTMPTPIYESPRKHQPGTKRYKPTPSSTATATKSTKPYIRIKLKNTNFRYSSSSTEDYQRLTERTTTESTPAYTTPPSSTTPSYAQNFPFVEVTSAIPKNYQFKPLLANQVVPTSTEKSRWSAVVSSKPVPLVSFFATTPSSVDQPVEATPASIKQVLTTESPNKIPNQASYYFYEESESEAPKTTQSPISYYEATTKAAPIFKIEALPEVSLPDEKENKKNYYNVEREVPLRQTEKEFNLKLIQALPEDLNFFKYLGLNPHRIQENAKPPLVKSQSTRLLNSNSAVVQHSASYRPSSKLSYFTTTKPKIYLENSKLSSNLESKGQGKSKPIYQYSFEATNYAGRSQKSLTSPEIEVSPRPRELSSNEFPEIQPSNDQYDYDGNEQYSDSGSKYDNIPYVSKKKERHYPSSTPNPIRDTTLASHQLYFTKQDEQLLDEVTKEYFTMFGKKINGKGSHGIPSTTPIYDKTSTEKPKYHRGYTSAHYKDRQVNELRPSRLKIHYDDPINPPYILKKDPLINYENAPPSINSGREFIQLVNPPPEHLNINQDLKQRQPVTNLEDQYQDYVLPQSPNNNNYRNFQPIKNYGNQRLISPITREAPILAVNGISNLRGTYPAGSARATSLDQEVSINFRNSKLPLNRDVELIGPLPGRLLGNQNQANAYFAYRLPGDAGHFYFLTPQAIEDRGYLFPRPRLIRRSRGRIND